MSDAVTGESASANQKPISPTVRQCLEQFGYSYDLADEGTDIRFHCISDGGARWRSRFLVHEEARLVELSIFLTDQMYPADRRGWVQEVAARLNEKLVFGSLGLQWDTGAVFFRREEDFRDRVATTTDIDKILNLSAFPLELWEAAYSFVPARRVPANLAATTAFILTDSFDGEPGVAARRAAMRVVPGGGTSAIPADQMRSESPATPTLSLL